MGACEQLLAGNLLLLADLWLPKVNAPIIHKLLSRCRSEQKANTIAENLCKLPV